jgi:poly(3-hydroxybutyrate) depolymerase
MKRYLTLALIFALTLAAGTVNGEPSHKDAIHLPAATGSKPGRTGQSSSKSSWETGIHHLQRGPLERQFRVHIPPTLESSTDVPLVLAFHGWGGNEHEFLKHRVVTEELDRRGWILIAPLGLGPEDGKRFRPSWSFSGSTTGLAGPSANQVSGPGGPLTICDEALTPDYTYPSCHSIAKSTCSWTHCLDDDIDFVLALIEEAKKRLPIDPDRIFAVGGSNGGMFTWELGLNERSAPSFRAFSSLIGLPHRGFDSPPPAVHTKPMLLITGGKDTTVPPGRRGDLQYTTTTNGEAYFYESASTVTRTWAEALQCDLTRQVPAYVESTPLDCSTWAECQQAANGPSIVDCRAPSMGHIYDLPTTWPVILRFFAQF